MPRWSIGLFILALLLLTLPLEHRWRALTQTQGAITLAQQLRSTPTLPKGQSLAVTQADRVAIRAVIQEQLAAFQQNNAAGAFALASPGIQSQFGTPRNFIAMVKATYPQVYRPQSVSFEELTTVEGNLVQKVLLQGPNGELVTAVYLMQKQSDGKWRINGCVLVPIPGQTI